MLTTKSGKFGDIKKLRVQIDGTDVTTGVILIEIYQDVFTPCWSAQVTLDDTVNWLMQIPIKPGSEVVVTVETEIGSKVVDGNKTYNFILYKIGDKVFKGQMHQQYCLYCATKGFLLNQGRRVQKCYPNMKPEQAVSNVISEYLEGSVDSVQSDNNYHVIVPNWSPFTTCWWYAKIAIKNNASDYIFFMNDEDKYWFKPIEHLYNNESTGVTFAQKPSDFRNDDGDFEIDYSVMINRYHFEHYDGLGNLGTGYYKNKLLTYDVINKKWEKKIFSYGDDIQEDKEKKPWSSELFDGAENANVSFLPKHPGMHSNPTIDDTNTSWHMSRKTNMMKLANDNFILQVPGGAKCWEWLGKTCEINLPSQQDYQKDEIYDKYFKGKYLIVSIYHHIVRDYYTTNVQAVKKRLAEKM